MSYQFQNADSGGISGTIGQHSQRTGGQNNLRFYGEVGGNVFRVKTRSNKSNYSGHHVSCVVIQYTPAERNGVTLWQGGPIPIIRRFQKLSSLRHFSARFVRIPAVPKKTGDVHKRARKYSVKSTTYIGFFSLSRSF